MKKGLKDNMNSLEFIEKEIKELEFQINYIKSNMEKYVAFRAEGRIEVDIKQLKLNQLQQIKSELEAWEVMVIKTLITDGGVIHMTIEDDDVGYETVIKALKMEK